MDPQMGQYLGGLSFSLCSTLCSIFPPVSILFPLLRCTEAPTFWSSFFLIFIWSVNCILGISNFGANIYLSVSTYCVHSFVTISILFIIPMLYIPSSHHFQYWKCRLCRLFKSSNSIYAIFSRSDSAKAHCPADLMYKTALFHSPSTDPLLTPQITLCFHVR